MGGRLRRFVLHDGPIKWHQRHKFINDATSEKGFDQPKGLNTFSVRKITLFQVSKCLAFWNQVPVFPNARGSPVGSGKRGWHSAA